MAEKNECSLNLDFEKVLAEVSALIATIFIMSQQIIGNINFFYLTIAFAPFLACIVMSLFIILFVNTLPSSILGSSEFIQQLSYARVVSILFFVAGIMGLEIYISERGGMNIVNVVIIIILYIVIVVGIGYYLFSFFRDLKYLR